MRNFVRLLACVAVASLAACVHAEAPQTKAEDKTEVLSKTTGSRLGKRGSARSRGVAVYQIRPTKKDAKSDLGEGLEPAKPAR